MRLSSLNRKIHYWGSVVCAIPVIIIIVTGSLLIFKKEFDWIQPKTYKGVEKYPIITFEEILAISKTINELNVGDWSDVSRLDIRPNKGMVKVRSKNGWELQIDTKTKKILNIDYRRSDIIEAIHTGTFFHKYISLGIFFPSALILLILWITGIYLFTTITITKYKNKRQRLKLRLKQEELF